MGDENQPSKKRAAGREISRDNPGLDDDEPELEMGTFKKASDDVLASRRIVKVRRHQTSATPPAPSSNPFAGIRLVPPAAPPPAPTNATPEAQAAEDKSAGHDESEKAETDTEAESKNTETEDKPGEAVEEKQAAPAEQVAEADQNGQSVKGGGSDAAEATAEVKPTDEKEANGSAEKAAEAVPADEKQSGGENNENVDKKENEKPDASGAVGSPLSSFQQLSNSQNAFTGLSGSGFSSSAFSFGSPSQSSLPAFSFGTSNNGSTPLFGTAGASSKSEGSAFRSMQEVPRETGEENEETVFSADSALFEFIDGGWKERGKGEVKVNLQKSEARKARLVMRTKGNLRLILNASLYPDMKLTKMDKKGITFACVNITSEIKDSLSTFALKFKDVAVVEEFTSVVSAHKGNKPATTLKTPENSPKASDD